MHHTRSKLRYFGKLSLMTSFCFGTVPIFLRGGVGVEGGGISRQLLYKLWISIWVRSDMVPYYYRYLKGDVT